MAALSVQRAAILVAAAMFSFPAQAIELLWGHAYSANSVYHQCALETASEISDATNGRYTVTVYPASSLGDEDELRRGLKYGNLDIAFLTAEELSVDLSSISLVLSPYAISDFGKWFELNGSEYYDELVRDYSSATGNDLSSVIYGGQRHLLANSHIDEPEQLSGTMIGVPKGSGPPWFSFTVDATPAFIHADELPKALSSGAIAGAELTAPQALEWQRFGTQAILNLTSHGMDLVVSVVAGKSSIRPSDRAQILDILSTAGLECAEIVRINEIKALEQLQNSGVVEVQNVDIQSFKDLAIKEIGDDKKQLLLEHYFKPE